MVTSVYDMASGELVPLSAGQEPDEGRKDDRMPRPSEQPGLAEHRPAPAPRRDLPTDLATIDCEIFIRDMEEHSTRRD
ncbi:MAG: hypothetical protein GWO16_06320 [Gammaproteobacteria bacterium]|nr:hypothetical protein [Gammaproteobacteria bacterium]NIR97653.1 hypothetical protein [Gammaproteobacteria bacterium]NIT63314.1 hypothetical protein [Gammaproteobacteria bacterium]NIV20232.1 hypothetical protein [Gammaproteobacteria bacterium]NIX10649.1 hypothetical protein [Gammaproteobacteria bacterium]